MHDRRVRSLVRGVVDKYGQNQERLIQNTRRSFAQKHSVAFYLKRRLTMKEIKRGEIYSADFGAGFGSEQGGVRPVLILQNNTGNKHSPTTIVAAITGRKTKAALPTHVAIMTSGLKTESTVLLEQIRTIDKARLGEYIGRLDRKTLAAVDRAIVVSLGIKYLEGLLNG
nr:MAG TPA: PemK-like protein [Caudoviricetes sp.]